MAVAAEMPRVTHFATVPVARPMVMAIPATPARLVKNLATEAGFTVAIFSIWSTVLRARHICGIAKPRRPVSPTNCPCRGSRPGCSFFGFGGFDGVEDFAELMPEGPQLLEFLDHGDFY